MKKAVTQLMVFSFILGGWYLVFRVGIINAILLPGPHEIAFSYIELFQSDGLLKDLVATFLRICIGFLGGLIFGLICGFIISTSKLIYKVSVFWLDFLRSIPAPALLPVFLLLFGIGDNSKVALVAFVVALIIILNTVYGIVNANKTRILSGQAMKLSKVHIFIKIIFPEALPYISAGIRLALSFSVVAVIVSEMLVSTKYGLGRKIIDYQLLYESSKMYAVVILTGVLGYIINHFYLILEKNKIHWMGK